MVTQNMTTGAGSISTSTYLATRGQSAQRLHLDALESSLTNGTTYRESVNKS